MVLVDEIYHVPVGSKRTDIPRATAPEDGPFAVWFLPYRAMARIPISTMPSFPLGMSTNVFDCLENARRHSRSAPKRNRRRRTYTGNCSIYDLTHPISSLS
jgi:hypothetical protein